MDFEGFEYTKEAILSRMLRMLNPKVEVSDKKPPDFLPKMEASACCLEIAGHLLLIQQAKGKWEESLWGVPAGKLELNETREAAAERELFEETGIQIQSPSEIQYLTTLYIRKPDIDYIYHMFVVRLDKKPRVRLSFEHMSYRWAKRKELESLPLRAGVKEALQYYW
jgi:8-oxo-dGTP diphosphatase